MDDSFSSKTMKHDFAEPQRDKPRWNQVRKVETSPRKLLKMAKVMDTQSKKKSLRYMHWIRVSGSGLRPATCDLQKERHLVGHRRFK